MYEMNEPRMNETKRKADVANLIHEFLIRKNLTNTANLLKKQALIADKQNVEQYIVTIQQSNTLSQDQKLHKIRTQLQKKYFTEISLNNYQSALKILNEKMPLYFSEFQIDKFAENLIPSSEVKQSDQKNQCLLQNMFLSYFIKNPFEDAKLPNTRVRVYNSTKQIWFVKFSGQYIVAIDQNRKGIIFSKHFELLYERQNLHDKMISNVKWRNEFQFGTCSESGEIKIWTHKFELIQTFKYHKKLINSFVFFTHGQNQFLVSGGHDKFIMFNNITDMSNNIQTKIKLKELIIRDIKYYKKRNELIFLNEKKKEVSTIKFLNPGTLKWIGEIKVNELLFEMQISPTDDILHVITQPGEILNYSLKTRQKIGVFIGTSAKNFVIRMQKGGYMNQFLATGSQSGEVLIYHEKKVEPIKRLKTLQKTVVNSITWIDDSTLVCGCDNGSIEFWSYQKTILNQPL